MPNQIIIQKRLKNNLLYKNTILQKNAYCVYISSCTQREFKCKCFKNVFLSKTCYFWKSILNIHFCINFHNFQQTKATPKEFIICNVTRILKSINLYAWIWIPATHEKYKFFLHSFDHLVNGIPGVYKEIIISLIISVIRKFLPWKIQQWMVLFSWITYNFHHDSEKDLSTEQSQWTIFWMNLGNLCHNFHKKSLNFHFHNIFEGM